MKKNDSFEEKNNNETNDDNKVKDVKALFIQRLFAFFIDAIIVSFIVSLITIPFVDNDKVNKINEKVYELSQSIMEDKISIKEYSYQYIDLTYDLAKSNGLVTLISVTVGIFYYVVFQIYNNGQTIGKKILKIRIKSEDGDLNMNQMIFRALISNSILVDLLSFVFVIFANKYVYFYCVGLFTLIHYTITLISIFMVMYSKSGSAIHDKLMHTRVVKVN